MSRGRLAFLLVSLLLVVPVVASTFVFASETSPEASDSKADPKAAAKADDSLYKHLGVFTEVLSLVRQMYVDETSVESLMANAFEGTTDALDPFSLYVPADEVDRYLEARQIGVSRSGLHLLKDNGVAFVIAIDKGSPAEKAGFHLGDILAEFQGRDTRTMPLWEMQEVLAGKPGTEVKVKYLRGGENQTASFTLADFAPPPPSIERLRDVPILHLPSLARGTAAEVKKLLGNQTAGDRLLIDLRGVAAGDAEEAYGVARLFTSGDLGALAGRTGEISAFTANEPALWKGKLVVLVDRGTLGAAEVLATVLKQKLAAELVGERTFGYAGRVAMADLSSGGRLIYTDAFFTGPDREKIRKSLIPDVAVDERSRTFDQKDRPIGDLILDRGIERLLADSSVEASAKRAA